MVFVVEVEFLAGIDAYLPSLSEMYHLVLMIHYAGVIGVLSMRSHKQSLPVNDTLGGPEKACIERSLPLCWLTPPGQVNQQILLDKYQRANGLLEHNAGD